MTTARRRNARNRDLPVTVDFLSRARDEILRQVMATTAVDYKEVGGWLLGSSRGTPNSVMVSAVSAPDPTDSRDHKSLILDERFGQFEADALGVELVGRWHTHPYRGSTELSDQDLRSGRATLEGRSKLVDVLVTPGLSESWEYAEATGYAYERASGVVTWHRAIVQGWDNDTAERQAARHARADGARHNPVPA